MSASIQTIPIRRIDGKETNLGEFGGKVLLVVNVASKCGLTHQYEGLEKLYRARNADGLVVVGFPANDFAGQEPGSNDEIATFCTSTYGVNFPMFEKITVVGPAKHPLYGALIAAQPTAVATSAEPLREKLAGFLGQRGEAPNEEPELLWNFEKFVVDRKGNVVARFAPDTPADDPALVKVIETELSKA